MDLVVTSIGLTGRHLLTRGAIAPGSSIPQGGGSEISVIVCICDKSVRHPSTSPDLP